jgi:hypothetical protein
LPYPSALSLQPYKFTPTTCLFAEGKSAICKQVVGSLYRFQKGGPVVFGGKLEI